MADLQIKPFLIHKLPRRGLDTFEKGVEQRVFPALPERAKLDRLKSVEGQHANLRMEFHFRHAHGHADAITVGDIGLHEFDRADFNPAEPFHLEFGQPRLKRAADEFVARHRDERFADGVALPEFLARI